MKWPLVFRSTLEKEQMAWENSIQLIETQRELIFSLQQQLIDKDQQISALTEMLTGRSVTVTPADSQKEIKGAKTGHHPVLGRAGWRTRAKLASESTIPPPSDSIKQLEDKVKREGGKI